MRPSPKKRLVFVEGLLGTFRDTPEEQLELLPDRLRTIAHEIGHILLGPGHPGYAHGIMTEFAGVSPLPGTDHKKRLMFAGEAAFAVPLGDKGTKLVKLEWDKTEDWLNDMIADPDKQGVR
jgi:hypothetical protein